MPFGPCGDCSVAHKSELIEILEFTHFFEHFTFDNNDITSAVCDSNCSNASDIVILNNGEERAKCIYRAVRVGWILEIVKMYNASDSRVKYWEKDNSDHRRRIYLRYQEDEIDYLVVFEKKNEKRVILVTGYPVFFISSKKDLDSEYAKYQKTTT